MLNSKPPLPMNQRANWLAWSLQFIVGLVVGAFSAPLFIRGGRKCIPLIAQNTSFSFILGTALIGAAFASHYGDRLWLGSSSSIFPPDAPKQSDASCRASIIVGFTGSVLVFVAICRSFGLLS